MPLSALLVSSDWFPRQSRLPLGALAQLGSPPQDSPEGGEAPYSMIAMRCLEVTRVVQGSVPGSRDG